MMTNIKHGIVVSVSIYLMIISQDTSISADLFPLRKGMRYTYQLDKRYDYYYMAMLSDSRDSGTVDYFVLDSTASGDTAILWSVLQKRNVQHWDWTWGAFDTSYNISDSLLFVVSELTKDQHELYAASLLWSFPVKQRWIDTLHVNRLSDSLHSLLAGNYFCTFAFGSFDSLWFMGDSGLYKLHWNRCEDLDNFYGTTDWGTAQLVARTLTTTGESGGQPVAFGLISVFPNPFNPSTTITYTLTTLSEIHLDIYDLLGRRVQELEHRKQPPGRYTVRFDGTNLASGAYIVGLRMGEQFTSTRIILAK